MKNIRIITLQRGWVVVGSDFNKNKTLEGFFNLENVRIVRKWGTDKGLGELSIKGPQANTVLDICGDLEIPVGAIIKCQKCDESIWSKVLS